MTFQPLLLAHARSKRSHLVLLTPSGSLFLLRRQSWRLHTGMARAAKQSIALFWLLFGLLVHQTPLSRGSETPGGCSGHFVLEDSTAKLVIQQYVNTTGSVVECRYAFEAPQHSGLLVIANDIRAVNDAEIPGCPVAIYNNAEASGDPVYSLCGHYATLTIPVPASVAVVVYKPEFNGEPYTLTLDLQVVLTGGSNLRACGDSRLSAVPAVPVRYSVGFRADAGSKDASDFCDLNATSKDVGETLGTKCVLTSEGVCNYEVLLSDGSVAESAESIDLADAGGSATVRLHTAGITGVLVTSLPAGFVPLSSLEPPPTVVPPEEATSNSPYSTTGIASSTETAVEITTGASVSSSTETSTDNVGNDDVEVVVDSPPSLWDRMTSWFVDTWETVKNAVTCAFKTVGDWFRSWF
ncbi:uncharacterized protein LOC144111420 [Amblyomma americanum]